MSLAVAVVLWCGMYCEVYCVLWAVLHSTVLGFVVSTQLCCYLLGRGYIRPSSCIVTQGQMISFLGTLPRIDLVCLT